MPSINYRMPAELKEVVRFHGHICPGLVIGYLAAKLGLNRLGASRAQDEELVAIVENNSCSVDAIQVLTGCTFGKGNFFFRDYGKQVFTFALRPSGRAVRVSLKTLPDAAEDLPEEERRAQRIRAMLSANPRDLFRVQVMRITLPPLAQIHKSVICEACGEKTMKTRIRRLGGRILCIPCAAKARGAREKTPHPGAPSSRKKTLQP